ncbi:hypothetical protein G6514_009330 [Epicoccum nigrum]|nr:hypothetical protein G6514_009330 [Epicoccum nigrum]
MYRLILRDKPGPQPTKSLSPCLLWPIFGDLSEIEVNIGMDEHGQPVRTKLFEHSIVAQPITQPPTSKLTIKSIDVLRILESEVFEVDTVNKEFEYEELLIETEDGSPITIGEFVAHTHEYLNQFKRIIIEYKCSLIYGTFDEERLARIGVSKEEIEVYFRYTVSQDWNDGLEWSVVTVAEGEYPNTPLEDIILRVQKQDN